MSMRARFVAWLARQLVAEDPYPEELSWLDQRDRPYHA